MEEALASTTTVKGATLTLGVELREQPLGPNEQVVCIKGVPRRIGNS